MTYLGWMPDRLPLAQTHVRKWLKELPNHLRHRDKRLSLTALSLSVYSC